LPRGRRKEKRYRVIEDVFAVTKSNPGIMGNILDISSRGLSFHCLANGDVNEDFFEIDLFFGKNGYLSQKISCRKVSDRTEHSRVPFSSLMMRRIGVSFIKLKPHQSRQLELFISHLTQGQVTDRRCGVDRRSTNGNRLRGHQRGLNFSRLKNGEDRRQNADRRFSDN
jgi:hypothetical protein